MARFLAATGPAAIATLFVASVLPQLWPAPRDLVALLVGSAATVLAFWPRRSVVAGTLGSIGAFGVLLAFGAKGTPSVVMSIVFAGAPIINAVVATALHPPKGGLGAIPWPFFLGIVLAAMGGCLDTLYKPAPGPAKAAVANSRPEGAGQIPLANPHPIED